MTLAVLLVSLVYSRRLLIFLLTLISSSLWKINGHLICIIYKLEKNNLVNVIPVHTALESHYRAKLSEFKSHMFGNQEHVVFNSNCIYVNSLGKCVHKYISLR